MFRAVFVLTLWISLSAEVSAQRFGGNPPSIKWRQLNTDTARIIFPDGLDKQAREVAAIVHQLSSVAQPTIGNKLRKIDIVLQNQTILSNGYVSLGPFRSEFFMTPTQNSFDLGSLPWHKTLALHEYRHVQQFNNFRVGLSKLFYYVAGEFGQAFANSLAIPDWFFEGDAVYQETIFSDQGRGRIPDFFNPYRSLAASGKDYSWMKLRNGSMRDLVPDHYRLGYLMVTYGREKYGDDVWKKITGDAARFSGVFYPFQRAVKKYTGENYKQFRKHALDQIYAGVQKDDTASRYGRQNLHFTGNEEFPQWMSDSEVVFVRTTYKNIATFYLRNIISGSEEKIDAKDISPDNYFSLRNGRIVYTAFDNDARWGWKSYGIIKMIDVASRQQRTLTRRTKYFSPDVSPDGKMVVAVHSDPSGKNTLHLIDAASGKVVKEMPNTDGFIYTFPKFYSGDSIVSAVRNNAGEMALGIFSLRTGTPQWLTPFTNSVIAFPTVNKDTVSFSMTLGDRDRLFMAAGGRTWLFNPEWKNNSTGDYHLTQRNGNYTWMNFTAAGLHVLTGKGQLEAFVPTAKKKGKTNEANLINTLPSADIGVQKYNKTHRLFNFHSWSPYFADPEYSYSLVGENILNTFLSELYFKYNRNEGFKETGASFAYAGWFPVLRLGGSYTFDRSLTDSSTTVTWNESSATIGASLPLNFTSGLYTRAFNFSLSLNNRQVNYTGASKSLNENIRFNFADISASFSNQRIRALQNIYPRLAQTLSIRHRFILNKYTAYQLISGGALYFPGLFTNHSLVFQGSYQFRDTLRQYNFSNTFASSRGYPELNFPRMLRFGVNYHLPIAYPDAGIGNIAYLLRLRGNVFYDFTRTKSLASGSTFNFRSLGLEIFFDSKWWNQLPISFGLRYSRLLDNDVFRFKPNRFEFVLPLTILGR